MTCIQVTPNVIVCRASDQFLRRRIEHCPICQCQREFVYRYEAYHGATAMCTGCGDSWTEEGLSYRPFKRNWRAEKVAHYRELYAVATHGPAPTFEELYPEDVAA